MRELANLLPELSPPPGGLAHLRHSLREQREPTRQRFARWLPATAGAGALMLLTLIWLPGAVSRERTTQALTRTLLQAATPPTLPNGIQVEHGAALLLTNGQADTRVYLIASTSLASH
ncbi:MAG: hypothetical protein RSP_03970 [Rhodanobacter sp.]